MVNNWLIKIQLIELLLEIFQVDVKLVDSLTRANSPFAYPGRTLVHQKLDLNNLKPKGVTQKDDIAFIKIPAVAPTTIQGSSDSMMTGLFFSSSFIKKVKIEENASLI